MSVKNRKMKISEDYIRKWIGIDPLRRSRLPCRDCKGTMTRDGDDWVCNTCEDRFNHDYIIGWIEAFQMFARHLDIKSEWVCLRMYETIVATGVVADALKRYKENDE